MITESQTTLNLSNDNRIASIYPYLIQAKQQRLDMLIKDKEIILNSLNSMMAALSQAFGIVSVDPLSNTTRLIFFAAVVVDLMIKETYLMLKFDEAEALIQAEIAKPLAAYYEILPKIIV